MAYGDDFPSRAQRGTAVAAIMLAVLELAYIWLVALSMAAAPNTPLIGYTGFFAAIMAGNGAVLFGRQRPARHWLRIFSWLSIALMIVGPISLVLTVIFLDKV